MGWRVVTQDHVAPSPGVVVHPDFVPGDPRLLALLGRTDVLAYPTETVYGLGSAIDSASVDALLSLKHRPRGKPFLLLISDSAMIERMGLPVRIVEGSTRNLKITTPDDLILAEALLAAEKA